MRRTLSGVALGLLAACGGHSGGTGGVMGGGTGGVMGGGTGGVTGPPGALSVWTAGVGRKIQPTTAAGTGTAISLASYRDAWISGQLVVRGDGGHLEGVTVAVTADLSDGAGNLLTKNNVTLFREAFIDFTKVDRGIVTGNLPVPANSPTSDSRVPDPLIPLVDPYTGANAGQPFNVDQMANQPIFVDVHIPKGLPAGTYTATIHVAATLGGNADVPLSVVVWPIDLPDMREVTTHFKMSIDPLTNFHAGLQTCKGGSCYLDLNLSEASTVLQRYEDLVHAHRIDAGQARVYAPFNGCTAPVASDWTSYDSAMTPYMNGTYFTDGVPSSRFDVPFSPGETFSIDGTCSASQYQAISAAWADHLQTKGWFPRPSQGGFGAIAAAYDEPLATSGGATAVNAVLNKIASDSALLQTGNPSWKVHVIDTTSPIPAPANPATTPLLDPALGVYVVSISAYDNFWEHGPFYGRQQWPTLFAKGIELWFYESNSNLPPYPTFATNSLDALEPVIMMWGSWYEKATGCLYWDIAHWTLTDPWGPNVGFGKTGDGVLIYPGNHDGSMSPIGSPSDVAIHGPIPSYRLKMIRQGLQDWAFFRLADRAGLTSFVQQQLDAVYRQIGAAVPAPAANPYWTTDETKMTAIRAAVAQKILAP